MELVTGSNAFGMPYTQCKREERAFAMVKPRCFHCDLISERS